MDARRWFVKVARLLRNWATALLLPVPGLGIFWLPRYLLDWRAYARVSKERLSFLDSHPCLNDRRSHTPFDPHYFYQAAWLARRLAASKPARHVDIGSDIRMISVLSAFVPTTFIDYRPLRVQLDGLTCHSGNLVALELPSDSVASLSCLHVVEHIGLGRYGDRVDPDGIRKALSELKRVLAPGGRLYLSLPVGRERVCFNAHRVLSAVTVLSRLDGLILREFSLVDDAGRFLEDCPLEGSRDQEYACGLFVFEKAA